MDTTVTIVEKIPDGDSLRLLFELPDATLLPCIIPKGYVALDGTSLTITTVDDAKWRFGIMLITHTQEKISLSKKSVGSKVNLEVDMVGKYVQKSVVAALSNRGGSEICAMVEKVVEEVLARKGEVTVAI